MSTDIIEKNVRVNEPFTLEFNEASGAGYVWKVVTASDKLTVDQSRAAAPGSAAGAIGGGSRACFTIAAQEPGEHMVVLAHFRPWEKMFDPVQVVHCRVTVQP